MIGEKRTFIPDELTRIILECAPYSDQIVSNLRVAAEAFIEAHHANPGLPSVEVGTRIGGSAWMFLKLLERLYDYEDRPMLWTVDPYGSKPYKSGIYDAPLPIFDDSHYVNMKRLLALYGNHAHWLMESVAFFRMLPDYSYWRPGKAFVTGLTDASTGKPANPMPIGELKKGCPLTFCLLDGDHDADTIAEELWMLFNPSTPRLMTEGGIVVVDNIDCDPRTAIVLKRYEVIRSTSTMAVLRA